MERKELVVKLDRLSKSDIEKIINSYEKSNFEKTISYNFSINFDENGQWKCTETDGKLFPTTLKNNSIQINLLKNDHNTPKTSPACDEIMVEINKASQPLKDPSSTTLDNNISTKINILDSDYNTSEPSSFSDKITVENSPQHKDASPTGIALTSSEPVLTVDRCSDALKKRKLWEACKKKVNKEKLTIGAIVFAKQKGYSPWPCRIVNSTRSSATVEYFGYNRLTGSVKLNEIVQIDENTLSEIGSLTHLMLCFGNFRDFNCFVKAISEYKLVMDNIASTQR